MYDIFVTLFRLTCKNFYFTIERTKDALFYDLIYSNNNYKEFFSVHKKK